MVHWMLMPLMEILKNMSVIEPNSRFKILWNILMFILVMVNFFTIPVKLTFNTFDPNSDTFQGLTYISGLLFFFDTVLNFNSAYFSKGLVITDRSKIIRNYMKRNFFIDIITLISYLFCLSSYRYLEAGVLVKVLKLVPLFENFEEILNLR